MSAIGWLIPHNELEVLRVAFPPTYIPVASPHCTLSLGVRSSAALPPPANGLVIAKVDSLDGIETLLVAINGDTIRPDGGKFHITWSLAAGRKPRESNDVIQSAESAMICPPVLIALQPARF